MAYNYSHKSTQQQMAQTLTGHIDNPAAILDLQVGAAQGAQGSGGVRHASHAGMSASHATVDRASDGGGGAEHVAGRGHGQRPLSRHVCQTGPRAHCGQQRLIKRLQLM